MISSLHIKPQTSLYHAYTEDKVSINRIDHQSRINRIISLDTSIINGLRVRFQMEMFRRTQVAKHMSQTEKDFWNDLAYIYDKVDFSVDNNGKFVAFDNCDDVIKKQQSVIEEIKLSYKGEEVDSVINQVETASRDNQTLAGHLLQYKMYGLFFMGLYGQVYNHSRKKIHRSALGCKCFIANEHFTYIQNADESNKDILAYRIKGDICEVNLDEWRIEAERIGINITENQELALNLYEGFYNFNIHTSELIDAEIKLSISYGENFRREQLFSLVLINDEESNDL